MRGLNVLCGVLIAALIVLAVIEGTPLKSIIDLFQSPHLSPLAKVICGLSLITLVCILLNLVIGIFQLRKKFEGETTLHGIRKNRLTVGKLLAILLTSISGIALAILLSGTVSVLLGGVKVSTSALFLSSILLIIAGTAFVNDIQFWVRKKEVSGVCLSIEIVALLILSLIGIISPLTRVSVPQMPINPVAAILACYLIMRPLVDFARWGMAPDYDKVFPFLRQPIFH